MHTFEHVFFNGRVFIPYFTFGDTSVAFTKKCVLAAVESGARVIELGIPFSDPIADGPVIQASHYRALGGSECVSLLSAFDFVRMIKKEVDVPIVLMLTVNLVLHVGVSRFFSEAERSGVDGVIVPDLPVEDASDWIGEAERHHVAWIPLVSTLSSPKRVRRIVKAASGFVYLLSSTGTTGERATISDSLSEYVKLIKSIKPIPVAIGFGVSTSDQVEHCYQMADGAIVGSVFARMIEGNLRQPEKALAKITRFISDGI